MLNNLGRGVDRMPRFKSGALITPKKLKNLWIGFWGPARKKVREKKFRKGEANPGSQRTTCNTVFAVSVRVDPRLRWQ